VRFGHSDGVALMFDYQAGQWATWTNHEMADAALWNGQYHVLKSNGALWKEADVFTDDGTPVYLKIGTPWLRIGSLQGFQRTRWISLLGEAVSVGDIRVTFYADYSDDVVATADYSITAEQVGEPLAIRYRYSMDSTAIRCTIEQISGTGEVFSLSGVSMEIGVKKGLRKKPSSQTIG
jgi:hypothetical protein